MNASGTAILVTAWIIRNISIVESFSKAGHNQTGSVIGFKVSNSRTLGSISRSECWLPES